jgi:hemerythrin-like domain-containing protein
MACHDKIRHFARLSTRLGAHVVHRGANAEAAQAAASILRYFDMAAPLHHAYEESDLFPALRALGKRTLNLILDELEAEHDVLESLWQSVKPWLEATARENYVVPPVTLSAFARRYLQHAEREENEVYGAIRCLTAEALAKIACNMCARRDATRSVASQATEPSG